ncbi:hypothetical protein EJ04DRAFT_165232 [Polyplosphaeria fusca]|uniref:Uncharacterized protein n=1 Tax=Polyplosphaeria fusca TaxID=682080 RepID=A0A9P4R888_9PLEO|nr:hypothetical protein EJ04DRAFT_165232 [Polyplosphaeria fusca]
MPQLQGCNGTRGSKEAARRIRRPSNNRSTDTPGKRPATFPLREAYSPKRRECAETLRPATSSSLHPPPSTDRSVTSEPCDVPPRLFLFRFWSSE